MLLFFPFCTSPSFEYHRQRGALARPLAAPLLPWLKQVSQRVVFVNDSLHLNSCHLPVKGEGKCLFLGLRRTRSASLLHKLNPALQMSQASLFVLLSWCIFFSTRLLFSGWGLEKSCEKLTSARCYRWCNTRRLQQCSGFWDGHQLFGRLLWRVEEPSTSLKSCGCIHPQLSSLHYTTVDGNAMLLQRSFSIPSRSQTEIQGKSISPGWHLWNNQLLSLQAWHQHSIWSSVSAHFKKDCPWSLWWLD